ncbi:hypothetical protein LMG27177_05000 [Paraburkholderia fynbosensis]|uniref:Uncharacterized protein n=1 Tax=Paraburkholderia fynbosensis TaxID=1200993 RepID=A0A6J5GLF2_9BURK|nr:hypothetical protein LMG27177_05000 [Paraburkholderia fynbosensis]
MHIPRWGRAGPLRSRTSCRAGVAASCCISISMEGASPGGRVAPSGHRAVCREPAGPRAVSTRGAACALSRRPPRCASCCRRAGCACSAARARSRAACRLHCVSGWWARPSTAGWIRGGSSPCRVGATCAGVSPPRGLRLTTDRGWPAVCRNHLVRTGPVLAISAPPVPAELLARLGAMHRPEEGWR